MPLDLEHRPFPAAGPGQRAAPGLRGGGRTVPRAQMIAGTGSLAFGDAFREFTVHERRSRPALRAAPPADATTRRWFARWERLPLAQLEPRHVFEYFMERIHKDATADELRLEARYLRTFFEWAHERGRMRSNPVLEMEPLQWRGRKRPLCWSSEEQERLLKVCRPPDKDRPFRSQSVLPLLFLRSGERHCVVPYLYPLVLLGLRTGLRAGNLLYLRWDHLRLGRSLVEIPASETRWGRALHVRLDAESADLLRMLREHAESAGGAGSARVFDSLDLPSSPAGVPDALVVEIHLRAACRRAGIREAESNSLRHSFAYNSARGGIPLESALDLVDWDDVELVERLYRKFAPSGGERSSAGGPGPSPRLLTTNPRAGGWSAAH